MSRIKASHAFAVAILALVAAIIVPAYAALTKGEKKTVKRLANAQITKRAPGLAVASADKLDGQDASDFTGAEEVHTPERFVVNDPNPGDDVTADLDLFAAGVFTVVARCADDFVGGGNDQAVVGVVGPSGSSFAGPSDGGSANHPDTDGANVEEVFAAGNQIKFGRITAAAPNGQVLTVIGTVEVGDPAGDCIFSVTGIGP